MRASQGFRTGGCLTTSHEQAVRFVHTAIKKAAAGGLIPERLQDQFCFRTPEALKCIDFIGSEQTWNR